MNAYLEAMARYARFAGRERRGGYWAFVGVALLVTALLTLIAGIVSQDLAALVYAACLLVHLLPSLAAACRRLHDSGRSGWWQLVALVPFVGLPWIVILLVWRGDAGANRFGDPPATAVGDLLG
jgi:uncharacterized membrane protein YhaH (DUF805 family)